MKMDVGSKVIYPSQGPCVVDSIVNRDVSGNPVSFYRLMLLDDSGGELLVPVERVKAIGLRDLLKKAEIPKLLGQLAISGQTAKTWKQRIQDNMKLLMSGSAFDLAEVVESLTKLNENKSLSFRESWMLEKAKKLLVCEVSEVLGETKVAAEEKINYALKTRTAV